MPEIAFSIGCRWTGLVARQDFGVDEKDLEHGVGLLMDGRPDGSFCYVALDEPLPDLGGHLRR
jgi:hypothetical protein